MASSTMHSVQIDPKRQIGAVELQYDKEFNIYGIRFIDRKRAVIAEETWREVPQGNKNVTEAQLIVPPGREIIGFHGTHDGISIKSLGLILW